MPTAYGFVQSLETRSNGWVEVQILAVHSNNSKQSLFITNLDGDLAVAHRKLAQVGLLRDAVAHTLPVAISYRSQGEEGNVVDDVTLYPSRSIEGRRLANWVMGVVIGLTVRERGPEAIDDPYLDEADDALATVLLADGNVETYRIDLQRAHHDTGHAMLAMCAESRRTRRTLRLFVQSDSKRQAAFVLGADWATLQTRGLEEVLAFVEQIGRRTESFDAAEPRTADHVWVRYTTAPDMTPEGDVSANGSFMPDTKIAWLHADSPLAESLEEAARRGLQVRLGLLQDEIHSAEVFCPLASAARPIWVTVHMKPVCADPSETCASVPTIQSPDEAALSMLSQTIAWRGNGYFNPGIWRLVVASGGTADLTIDDKPVCLTESSGKLDSEGNIREDMAAAPAISPRGDAAAYVTGKRMLGAGRQFITHAYLKGMHDVQVVLRGHSCRTPFRLLIYRIR